MYVSVNMVDPFGNDDIALSLQSCYATSTPERDQQTDGNIHHLIVGR